jgi:hypothetical protein
MVLSIFLTILLTIQNIIWSYCHIVNIATLLRILPCIVNNIARDWFADHDGIGELELEAAARPGSRPGLSGAGPGSESDLEPASEPLAAGDRRRSGASGRLPHGIYHPKSGIYHLRYIPWYIPKGKMVYIMVYTIDIYHGIYHYYHGIYHRYIPWYI